MSLVHHRSLNEGGQHIALILEHLQLALDGRVSQLNGRKKTMLSGSKTYML
jgi:hypothetical protein